MGCSSQTTDTSLSQSNQQSKNETPLVELSLESYKQYLDIHDITIDDVTDGAIVTGYIKNNGDKEIAVVEFTIYYLDKNGKPVGESNGLAVNEDGNDNYIRVKPNYDCQFTDIVPEKMLKVWDHKVFVEITKIRIEK